MSIGDKEVCLWSKEDEDNGGYYETECGQAFEFNNEGWEENHFIYCPYCGKHIADKQLDKEV